MNALIWQLVAGKDQVLSLNQYPHFYALNHLFNEIPKIDPGPHPKMALSELFTSYQRIVRLRVSNGVSVGG